MPDIQHARSIFTMSMIRTEIVKISQRHTMLVFLLDCLRFSKLLKLHQTEGRISNNLLKRKQSSRKTSSTWRPGPLIEVVGVESHMEWEAVNSTNFLLCLPKSYWLL